MKIWVWNTILQDVILKKNYCSNSSKTYNRNNNIPNILLICILTVNKDLTKFIPNFILNCCIKVYEYILQ